MEGMCSNASDAIFPIASTISSGWSSSTASAASGTIITLAETAEELKFRSLRQASKIAVFGARAESSALSFQIRTHTSYSLTCALFPEIIT
jgi:hypothetical protein